MVSRHSGYIRLVLYNDIRNSFITLKTRLVNWQKMWVFIPVLRVSVPFIRERGFSENKNLDGRKWRLPRGAEK